MVEKQCAICGKDFTVSNKRKDTAKVCSRSCAATYRNNSRFHSDPTFKKEYESKICEYCGKEFLSKESKFKFCTHLCAMNHINESHRAEIIHKICVVCGKKFDVKDVKNRRDAKYCSVKCSASIENSRETEHTCLFCEKKFLGPKNSKFCSNGCKLESSKTILPDPCLHCGKQMIVYGQEKTPLRLEKRKFCCIQCSLAYSLINGRRIPKTSKYETQIIDALVNIGVPREDIVQSYRPLFMNGKEIDIYLPKHNVGIEFNGLFWHSELGGGKHRTYHIDKSILCFKNGIKLIHIFEDTWADKQDIIVSRLKNILNIDQEVVYARNCSIREIPSSESKAFLNSTHLQGNVNAQFRYGLFDMTDTLVSVMTFGKNRRALGSKSVDNHYELLRYASTKTIVGGFSKLLNHFKKTVSPKKIISYMDLSWNVDPDSNVYSKSGFAFKGYGVPNYWYTQDYEFRENRFKFRKSELLKEGFDSSQTESQIMVEKGYDKVFDCGSAKFEIMF